MDVTYYLADAFTGNIVPGVTIPLTAPVFTRRIPAGTFSATFPTNAELDQFHQVDFGYLADLAKVMEEGAYTICPVINGVSIGEWLIWRSEPDDVTGDIALSGFEWGMYPGYRSLERDYVYNGRDQALVLYDMLTDCFKTGQPVEMFIPQTTHGATVTIDQRAKTAYYGDAIDDLLPGLEWFIWSRAVWENDVPVRMARDVIMAKGKHVNARNTALHAASPNSPGGSLLSWKRARDRSKIAVSVTAFGRGQGDKQTTAQRVNTPLLDGKHLITTRHVTYSSIEDQAALQARVDMDALLLSSSVEPVRARVSLDDFPIYPGVGDTYPVTLDPRPTYPKGYEGTYRVGETTVRPTGDRLVIDMLMEPA